MTRIPVLVPRRAGNAERDRLWEYCRSWWETEAAWQELGWFYIVEGHHDDGPFNRGAAINDAARRAGDDWNLAVIADGDVVTKPDQLIDAIASAQATGRLTLPYEDYFSVGPNMTGRVLAGYRGDWTRGVNHRMKDHVSSMLVVPRQLWQATRGFDERFEGWGHDDVSFAQACRVLGGGVDKVPGAVWHLHHARSPEREKGPLLRASEALARRYYMAVEPESMRRLIAERDEPDGVLLVVITNGRRSCIQRTIASAEQQLHGLPITRRLICDDSGDRDYQAWLRIHFDRFDLLCGTRPQGFGPNCRLAWQAALESGQRYTYWLEDDFVHQERTDLAALARVLEQRPHLAQIALRRQLWFPVEKETGCIGDPALYRQEQSNGARWLEHEQFWTTNPHLIDRLTLASFEWPKGGGSEVKHQAAVFKAGRSVAYWGTLRDKPKVHHIGEERVGSGY